MWELRRDWHDAAAARLSFVLSRKRGRCRVFSRVPRNSQMFQQDPSYLQDGARMIVDADVIGIHDDLRVEILAPVLS